MSAVIATASLAVGMASLGETRAQRQADTDIAGVAGRLAIVVRRAEEEARRQLLGGQDGTIDVEFCFQKAAVHNVGGAGRKGRLNDVVVYYRRLRPRRMVITGAGGSGKTVLAVELILGLLRDRRGAEPVPVRISAASLDTSRPPETAITDWLIRHLRQAYGLPIAAARELVRARMILPVLDGLDEMDAITEPGYVSRAGLAIRACNAYLNGEQQAAIVLTCRDSQYKALEQARVWVRDAARIQLRPVGVAAARRFLARRADEGLRWRPVLREMSRPGGRPLTNALSTPWRLTLAATVYNQRDPSGNYLRDPADLVRLGLDTEDGIRDHLLSLFIPAAIAAYGDRYPAYRVHQWLAVLADYLDSNIPPATSRIIAGRTLSGTDVVLHELWPLAGVRAPRILTVGLMIFIILGNPAWWLAHLPIKISPLLNVSIILLAVGAIWSLRYVWTAWPSPRLIDSRQLKAISGQRRFAAGFGLGFGLGFAIGFTVGLAGGFARGNASGIASGLLGGLGLGLVFGLDPGQSSATDPRQIVRSSLAVGFASAPVVGLATALASGVTLADAIAGGITGGITATLILGLVGWRYIALVACTRRWNSRWLPCRPGRFLNWCYQAGLVRIAGIGYQFRHRELQDYLTRNPHPPDARMIKRNSPASNTGKDQPG